ncbi:VOC family protein [Burkholderia seminalis]|uniref:VOC family protein n=2 Tax=Burkholderia cepacia complex TaxID=87882 RepID=A0A8A8DFZ6_9BURK|nr:VOC family protein [Burkholderia seminalis]QTO23390.1 VOC family protein [Burkholderia seminalis]
MLIGKLGPVMQVAYVVDDVDAAIALWSKLGVGPFFVSRHVRYAEQTYRGEYTNCDITAAFAYSGDLQIELVQQHNAAPSVFADFRSRYGAGVQHFGVLSNDIAADTAALADQRFFPLHRTVSSIGVETVFFEPPLIGGTVLELIQASPLITGGFAQMKAAAQAWDGNGPSVIEL